MRVGKDENAEDGRKFLRVNRRESLLYYDKHFLIMIGGVMRDFDFLRRLLKNSLGFKKSIPKNVIFKYLILFLRVSLFSIHE